MVTYGGIGVTDEINRYNEIFTLQAMFHAYEKQWNEIIPSFANHNHKMSIGFSKLTGIFLDSRTAYMTNSMTIGENAEEETKIRENNYRILYETAVLNNIDKYRLLEKELEKFIVGEVSYYWTNGVLIHNKDIVKRVFPDLFSKMENGLLDIGLLSPVLPGVYKIGKFLVFAHLYFRRDYSYLNTLNTPFLSRIEALDHNVNSIRIAIDLDCIGLAGTEHSEHEYSYWWGPKFSDDLKSIPLGVTRHENEHYHKILSNCVRTEFGWYIQDNKHTFESEEVIDVPNIKIAGADMYACRFVHSMVDNTTGLPVHLDGAIRTYSDNKIIERLDISIKDSERDTIYKKLWRIDGTIPICSWKELITHYYRDNMMVGEYFGAKDDKLDYSVQKRDDKELNEIRFEDFVPCNIVRGEGIKIYFSYAPQEKTSEQYDICVRTKSSFVHKGQQFKYIESETISLCKLIERKGCHVRMPFCKEISFNDMVYNYPIFECRTLIDAKTVVTAVKEMCAKWKQNGDDRIISFTIKVPYENRAGVFRFLGHVDDFNDYYANSFDSIPDENDILDWLQKSYDFIKKTFTTIKSSARPFDIIGPGGCLSVRRNYVPPKRIASQRNDGHVTLFLTKEEKKVVDAHGITAVVALIDESVRCSKCKRDYRKCNCIKTIDKDVIEEIEKGTLIGATWTNRNAFI